MSGDLAKKLHHHATNEWRKLSLPDQWKEVSFKTYPRAETIKLVESLPLSTSLETVLTKRQTTRSFDSGSKITFAELSTIIFKAAGIGRGQEDTRYSKRFYPSAGGRYPLEIYVNAERVEGLPKGVYHYNVENNSLERLFGDNLSADFKKNIGYEWSKGSSAMLLITSVWERTLSKYQNFGYKLICTEAGHLSQNIQLVAQALNLDYASIAGLNEKEMEACLSLDSNIESALYVSIIGKAKPSNQESA